MRRAVRALLWIGNAAALHSQHDIYGEMVLALTPIFLDERLWAERSPAALRLIDGLTQRPFRSPGYRSVRRHVSNRRLR